MSCEAIRVLHTTEYQKRLRIIMFVDAMRARGFKVRALKMPRTYSTLWPTTTIGPTWSGIPVQFVEDDDATLHV